MKEAASRRRRFKTSRCKVRPGKRGLYEAGIDTGQKMIQSERGLFLDTTHEWRLMAMRNVEESHEEPYLSEPC